MTEKKTLSQKSVTPRRLMNVALYYLGRYETSASRLSAFLLRRAAKEKMKGAEVPDNIKELVAQIVEKACEEGYVNDERYADSLVRRLRAAGKSKKAVLEKLRQNGISEEIREKICASFADGEGDSDLEAALLLVRKKRLGPYRPEERRREFRKKDLAVLARAGFSFDTAVKALGASETEDDFEY